MKWVLIALCELGGIYLVFCAFKQRKDNSNFELKHLFSNRIIMSNASWQWLLINGILGILLGGLTFFLLRNS